MATRTRYYNLTKPEGTDLVNIEDLNGNFDVIDLHLKENEDAIGGKQAKLTFDTAPTRGSGNPVTSGGIHAALEGKQDTLSFDATPTAGSTRPVTSGGVRAALEEKQDTLTFDTTPTAGSTRPVTSGGVKTALNAKQDKLTFDTTPTAGSTRPVTSGGIKRLFTESCGMYLFVCEVSLRDRSYNRLRHRAFHGEAVPGDEKLYAKIPQLFVMNP